MHYHDILLDENHEYLTFSRTGEESIFSYHNEEIDLVYHVQMFTEIKFTSPKGNFSLYLTTTDRTRWQKCFTLSSPLTDKELSKIEAATKIEIILPEEKKIFTFDSAKNKEISRALACLR